MNSKFNKVLAVPIAVSVGAATLSSTTDLQLISKASAATKYEYVVVADSLRVREKPSTNSKQIGSVKKKEKLVVQKELSSGWLQITFKGKVGYVSEEYVTKQTITQQPNPDTSKKYEYIVATNVLNVRDKASTLGNRLGTYKMGQKLQAEKELSNGWLQIKHNGRTAYVSMEYVLKQAVNQPVNPPVSNKYSYIVTTDGLNVRDKPSTLGKRLGKYNKNQVLQAKKELGNGWLEIIFEGRIAYVSMEYVKKQKQNDPPVQEKPADNAYQYIVTEDGLNIRKSPTTSSAILGKYKKGQVLQVQKELSNGWLQIKFNGRTAYVSMEYVKKQSGTPPQEKPANDTYRYIVTENGLNVRDKPSTLGKRLGKYNKNQVLQAKKELGNGWLEIIFEGRTAYVSMEYVKKQSGTPPQEKPANDTYRYVVTENGLNIRKNPTTSSATLGKYQKGQILQVKKELSNGWLQIKFDGEIAYVSMDYVEKQKIVAGMPPIEETNIHAYNYFVDATTLNIRMAPSIYSEIIDQAYKGQQLDVKKEIYGWYEIEYEGLTGYVSTGYVKIKRKGIN